MNPFITCNGTYNGFSTKVKKKCAIEKEEEPFVYLHTDYCEFFFPETPSDWEDDFFVVEEYSLDPEYQPPLHLCERGIRLYECIYVDSYYKSYHCTKDGKLFEQERFPDPYCFGEPEYLTNITLDECYYGLPERIVSNCPYRECYGKPSWLACSSHGVCQKNGVCNCYDGWSGLECDTWSCYGLDHSNPSVCSGNGGCFSQDVCICSSQNFGGKNCNISACFGRTPDDPLVCSGHGSCNIGTGNCICDASYVGPDLECRNWECFSWDVDNWWACNSVGDCIDWDNCTNCYVNMEGFGFWGEECKDLMCGFIEVGEMNICSGNGNCTQLDSQDKNSVFCECNKKYSGRYCDIPVCSPTCQGNRKCYDGSPANHYCNCTDEWGGIDCDECVNVKWDNSSCLECLPRYNSSSYPNCDECANVKWDYSYSCFECLPRYNSSSYPNCDECANVKWDYSNSCFECLPRYNSSSYPNCDECANVKWDYSTSCLECLPRYNSSSYLNCDECANVKWDYSNSCFECFPRYNSSSYPNCDECANVKWDYSTSCLECLPGYNSSSYPNCDECANVKWDYSYSCLECLPRYNSSSYPNCDECANVKWDYSYSCYFERLIELSCSKSKKKKRK